MGEMASGTVLLEAVVWQLQPLTQGQVFVLLSALSESFCKFQCCQS